MIFWGENSMNAFIGIDIIVSYLFIKFEAFGPKTELCEHGEIQPKLPSCYCQAPNSSNFYSTFVIEY